MALPIYIETSCVIAFFLMLRLTAISFWSTLYDLHSRLAPGPCGRTGPLHDGAHGQGQSGGDAAAAPAGHVLVVLVLLSSVGGDVVCADGAEAVGPGGRRK